MEILGDNHFLFQTKELNFLQKLMQVYWVNPKSWLLESFEVNSRSIKIIRKNGQIDSISSGEYKSSFSKDNYDRREIKLLTSDGRKIHFKEIPGMLSEEEWDVIIEILEATESTFSKTLHSIREIMDELKE